MNLQNVMYLLQLSAVPLLGYLLINRKKYNFSNKMVLWIMIAFGSTLYIAVVVVWVALGLYSVE